MQAMSERVQKVSDYSFEQKYFGSERLSFLYLFNGEHKLVCMIAFVEVGSAIRMPHETPNGLVILTLPKYRFEQILNVVASKDLLYFYWNPNRQRAALGDLPSPQDYRRQGSARAIAIS